jgi:hypothetical protein
MATVPIPADNACMSWKFLLKRLARSFRARPATTVENSLIVACVNAYSSAYSWYAYAFLGKWSSGRKMATLAKLMDNIDVTHPLDAGLETALDNLCNGLDIKRYTA